MNVLVIEAASGSGGLVKELVEGWGHAAEVCSRGQNALQTFQHGAFELVLLEVASSDGQADLLIRQLKGIRPDTLIVVMTDRSSYGMEVRIRELGILYYLIKPLEIENLEPLLEHVNRRKKALVRASMSAERKQPLKKQEVFHMNSESSEIRFPDPEEGQASICSTCEHRRSCMLRRRNQRPVFFCEEFQPAGSAGSPGHGEKPGSWAGAARAGSAYLGLCRTCRKLSGCGAARPGGGTWHCADYEKRE